MNRVRFTTRVTQSPTTGTRVRRSGRALRLLVALVLVGGAAACGRSSSTTSAPSGASTTPGKTGSTLGLDQGAFGDLGVICHDAKDASANKSSDIGVTSNEVAITTFSDPGYAAVKGLNQELFDTATAFSTWCNEHGGINGRKIKVTLADGALFEASRKMVEACDAKTFMSVGGGNVFDDTMQKDRLGCKNGAIPQVAGYLVTANASDSDLSVLPSPSPLKTQGVGMFRWLKEKYPDSMQKIGILTGQVPTTEVVARRVKEAVEQLGDKVIYTGLYPPAGTDNWRPYVAALQSKGVRGLYWVGQPAGLGQMLSNAKGLGLDLDWVAAESNHYDPSLFQSATPPSAVDGVYVNSGQTPFLPGAPQGNDATKQYLELIDQYAGASKKIASLGDTSLSAWLLWAKAADACGADLTRDCVWDKLQNVHEWTGGGLHAQTDPGAHRGSPCYALLEAKDGKFVPVDVAANTGIFNCSPDNVVQLKGDYGSGVRCPNPAFKSDPKPSTCGTASG